MNSVRAHRRSARTRRCALERPSLKNTRGATALEYTVVIGLIALGGAGALATLGDRLSHSANEQAKSIGSLSTNARRTEARGAPRSSDVERTTGESRKAPSAPPEILLAADPEPENAEVIGNLSLAWIWVLMGAVAVAFCILLTAFARVRHKAQSGS